MENIEIKNCDGIEYLKEIKNNTIDLILTDPPYIISRESGMNTLNQKIEKLEISKENAKTEEDWEKYFEKNKETKSIKKLQENITKLEKGKENYIKYGTIYGKKYSVKTDYGDWDSDFTIETLELYIIQYYKKLKNGGTIIIFFDLWKITELKNLLEKHKFKQIRLIEWIKTNPQPLNSSLNYLTNCREIAITAVKGSKPTFNSKYDNGIYHYPLQSKNRTHPTQKNLELFEELIRKHSNENDTVLDTFLGSGTTAIACKNTNRQFKGCELLKEYFDKIIN